MGLWIPLPGILSFPGIPGAKLLSSPATLSSTPAWDSHLPTVTQALLQELELTKLNAVLQSALWEWLEMDPQTNWLEPALVTL